MLIDAILVLVFLVITAGVVFCGYMLARVEAVYRYRKGVIDDASATWEERKRRLSALPSYDAMVWHLGMRPRFWHGV